MKIKLFNGYILSISIHRPKSSLERYMKLRKKRIKNKECIQCKSKNLKLKFNGTLTRKCWGCLRKENLNKRK